MSITLRANGQEYRGWKSVEVSASMGDAARGFSIKLAEPSAGEVGGTYWIAPGDEVQIFTGEAMLLDGFVNDYSPSFSATSHDVTISGRSKSQDAVDCSAMAENGNFEDLTPDQIGQRLLANFDFNISSEVDLAPVRRFQVNVGESIFHALDRLVRAQGAMLMGMADGSISITRASSERKTGILAQGSWPLLGASAKIADTNTFSEYNVRSQIPAGAGRYGADASEPRAKFTDGRATRHRPKVMVMEYMDGGAASGPRAEWQARRIAGQDITVSAEVQGHFYEGELWEPNRLIFLKSPFLKCAHDMIIESCRWVMDGNGTRTRLELKPPSALGGESGAGADSGGGSSASSGADADAEDVIDAWNGSAPTETKLADTATAADLTGFRAANRYRPF